MSETKRRSKQAEPDNYEKASTPRQTRVTLAKDVSSKYRKVMPRAGSAHEGDGSAPPKRRSGPGGPSSRPARPPRNFSGERSERPSRSFSGERPTRPPRSSFDFGRAPRPMRDGFDQTALKAIAHRGLPEAAKQIQEAQNLLLKSAEDILRLTEQLNVVYENLKTKFSTDTDSALVAELETAREAVTHIFEDMSFQDLVGQRLMKVDDFFKALDEALKKPAPFPGDRKPSFKRDGGAERKSFGGPPRRADGEKRPYKRREDSDRKPYTARGEKPERKSRLKGPQAEGHGLGQTDIDQLLKDL